MPSLVFYTIATAVAVVICLTVSHTLEAIRRKILSNKLGCAAPVQLPSRDPFFGSDLLLEDYLSFKYNCLTRLSCERFNQYGNTWQYAALGKTSISTIDMENLQALFVHNMDDYVLGETRQKILYPVLGKGISTSEGHFWRASRQAARPMFATAHNATVEKHLDEYLNKVSTDRSSFNFSSMIHEVLYISSAEILFGRPIEDLYAPDDPAQRVKEMMDSIQYIVDFQLELIINGYIPTLKPKYQRAVRTLDNFIQKNANAALEDKIELGQGLSATSIAKALLHRSDDAEVLHGTMKQFILGFETMIAELLTHAVLLLSQHPRVWDKLRQEVKVFGGRIPTRGELNSLKYLNQIINETLRIFPIAPFNNRTAIRDTTLPRGGGPDGSLPILVPKGTEVGTSQAALNRRKEFYGDDVESFIPERWDYISPGPAFAPFGIGRRSCPGRGQTMEIAQYVIARICQQYSSIRNCGKPWEECITNSLRSKHGTVISLERDLDFQPQI